MVVGRNKFICFYHDFINSIWCGYLNPIQKNPLPFQVFLQHQIFSYVASGASIVASCVSYSNMPFALTRDFIYFLSFPILPNAPQCLFFKNFSSDTFSLYILIGAVHGSFGATLNFSRSRQGSYGTTGWVGDKNAFLFIGNISLII